MAAGVRTVPTAGELTASLISRAAAAYGLPAAGVLRLWTCRSSPVRHDGGGVRADAEVVLNEAGRAVLAELCGVKPAVLARALPAFTVDDPKISTGREAALAQGRWRAAGGGRGGGRRGVRLPVVHRAAQRAGAAGGAVSAAPAAGVRAARAVACWTRTPTSLWNTSTCAARGRWWPHSGGGRAWRGVRCEPGGAGSGVHGGACGRGPVVG
ncbi:hypothetical protein [Streptomyces europaeiscabiei]|uniref:hypothetical protein n=1 Tax=Streptomyces europaeiscabiei TaxID=146819 RepID=UPI0038F79D41